MAASSARTETTVRLRLVGAGPEDGNPPGSLSARNPQGRRQDPGAVPGADVRIDLGREVACELAGYIGIYSPQAWPGRGRRLLGRWMSESTSGGRAIGS